MIFWTIDEEGEGSIYRFINSKDSARDSESCIFFLFYYSIDFEFPTTYLLLKGQAAPSSGRSRVRIPKCEHFLLNETMQYILFLKEKTFRSILSCLITFSVVFLVLYQDFQSHCWIDPATNGLFFKSNYQVSSVNLPFHCFVLLKTRISFSYIAENFKFFKKLWLHLLSITWLTTVSVKNRDNGFITRRNPKSS